MARRETLSFSLSRSHLSHARSLSRRNRIRNRGSPCASTCIFSERAFFFVISFLPACIHVRFYCAPFRLVNLTRGGVSTQPTRLLSLALGSGSRVVIDIVSPRLSREREIRTRRGQEIGDAARSLAETPLVHSTRGSRYPACSSFVRSLVSLLARFLACLLACLLPASYRYREIRFVNIRARKATSKSDRFSGSVKSEDTHVQPSTSSSCEFISRSMINGGSHH